MLDGRSLGTPAYLAQQLEGEPVDGRADLLLARLPAVRVPDGGAHRARARLAVAWAHLEQEPPAQARTTPRCPPPVDEPLRTALAKDRANEQPTCAALIAATETALGLGAPRRSRRRTLLFAAGAAVLAGLAAVIAALIAGSGSKGGPAGPLRRAEQRDPHRSAAKRRRRRRPLAAGVRTRKRLPCTGAASGSTATPAATPLLKSFDASTKHVQTWAYLCSRPT